MDNPKQNLIRILQNAHAGELAAARAYNGHWRSVRDPEQKKNIRRIELEELDHRERVREWLGTLDSAPRPGRERVFGTIGSVLGVLCFVSGWFFPMYFAGRLESQNTEEYREAARYAEELGMKDCVADLLEMSAKELEHEEYFRSVVAGHWMLKPVKAIFNWS